MHRLPEGQYHLVRGLGLFTTCTIVIGAVIGSGIFRTPGGMAGELLSTGEGTLLLFLGIWIVAGFITLLGALSNAEVASMIPETGGQYVYFERMYGRFPAFLYGWSVFSVIQTGSIAAIAYVFAEYAARLLGVDPGISGDLAARTFTIPLLGDIRPFYELPIKLIAAGAIAFLTGVNYLGVLFGGAVQNVFTVAKVVAILALVILAFLLDPSGAAAGATFDTARIGEVSLLVGIAGALQGAFWTYDGWNNVTYIAGEVRNPTRNIPRALIIGLAVIITVYLLVNLAYTNVMPLEEMAESSLVASDVADRLIPGGGFWVAILVVVSTFGTTNGTILASARVYFSMARRKVFPGFLGEVHPRFRTPGAALVTQALWSILLLFSGTFNTLIDMLLFVSWVFYAAGGIGLFVLRRREPDVPRPYRVPLYPVLPAIFVLFALAYVVLTIVNDFENVALAAERGEPAMLNWLLGTILVLAGTPVYFYFIRRRGGADGTDESHG